MSNSTLATPDVVKSKQKITVRCLCESAILIAIGTILSMIKIINYPWGGGVTICAMLPIILIGYRWGVKWGFFSSFVFGVLQLSLAFIDNDFGIPSLWALIAMLLIDYILAYTMLGFGGIFRNKFKSPAGALVLGTVLAVFMRYFMHFVSGAIFFGEWASWFFGDTTSGFSMEIGGWVLGHFSGVGLSMLYSATLNGITMLCEMAITVVAAVIVAKIPVIGKKMN